MPDLRRQTLAALAIAAFLALPWPGPARAAAPDNNVEWNGVSHISWQDLRPLCPVAGESFAVRFQTWRDDITSARVLVTVPTPSDTTTTPAIASKIGTRGPYDVWQAQVPAVAQQKESYVIELTDGADTDYYGPNGMSDGVPATEFQLDFFYYTHAPVGATLTSGGSAVFKVWAPTRTSAYARGDFNSWEYTTLWPSGGYLAGRVGSVSDGDEYKFYFPYSGGIDKPDPRARALVPNPFYNSRIEDPFRYTWRIEDFETPPLAKMVIYQLHVGTFSGRNDPMGTPSFPGGYLDVAARAGHLAELGVNAVMLNPVTEFPFDESAGYNPITAWSPESAYGTPDELKAMVDSLHARGIAVLLDILWNHVESTDNFLWFYDGTQQWFDDPVVVTPWGSQADFDKQAVRDYYANSALYWLEEFKLDGFRMDATDFMNMDGSPQAAAGWDLMQRFNDDMDNRWVDKIAIAEQLPDDSWVTRPTASGGAGFDSQYFDWYTDTVRWQIEEAAFGNPDMWRIRDVITTTDPYLSGSKVVNYIQLHDEAWPTSGGGRMVKAIDPSFPHDDQYARGRMKLGLGLTMFAPGVPAMLMGDEWLEDTDFGTGSGNRIDWAKKTTYADHFAYVKRIIGLRTTVDAFRADRYISVHTPLDEDGNVIVFTRRDASGTPFIVIANFHNDDHTNYRIGAPWAGGWTEMVNSESAIYGGDGPDNPGTLTTEAVPYQGLAQSLVLNVPARGLIVLGPASIVDVADRPVVPSKTRIERILPVPARDAGAAIDFALSAPGDVRLEVLDVAGRRIARVASGAFEAGLHRARWDGRDEAGHAAKAGIYFVRLKTDEGVTMRRLPLVR